MMTDCMWNMGSLEFYGDPPACGVGLMMTYCMWNMGSLDFYGDPPA